ncbi:hypothetical protein [Coleofasciculus sp. G2-EDA-02]|uniref:hypothetical protein n=1 Tax=Coleofasciculus sp. G2-EDA-02 TaxID=3069529 RepID=UPI0032FE40A4
MALPNNFSPSEQLQDLIRKVWNRKVREHFKDLGGEDWEPNLSSTRAQYRVGCTHLENDTTAMTQLRIELFSDIKNGSVLSYQYIFGIPKDKLDGEVAYVPHVTLYFCQKSIDVEPRMHFKEGEITFRWTEETEESITSAKIENLANKIKLKFTNPTYRWNKGKTYYYYYDKQKGYDFRLLARNVTEAKRIIADVLDLRNDIPDWKSYLRFTEVENPRETFPESTGTKTVLSKPRKKPVRRPEVDVYFRYALLSIPLVATITLVDLTGTRSRPVV